MAVDVSIVPCKSYDAEECRTALTQALAPFGGLDWVKEGMHIVIKVNLVSAMKPEQAATTHPMLLCELTKMLRERGASVLLGDSPGGLYTAAHLNHVYDVSGMHDCEAAGAELNQDFSQSDASFPGGRLRKEIHLYRLSRQSRRDHRLLQAQDARHDGHDKRRQKSTSA